MNANYKSTLMIILCVLAAYGLIVLIQKLFSEENYRGASNCTYSYCSPKDYCLYAGMNTTGCDCNTTACQNLAWDNGHPW